MKILLIILQLNLVLAPIAAFAARGPLFELQQNILSGPTAQIVFDGQRNLLPAPVKQALHRAAHDQAQIWGDTILEGDYETRGDTRIDVVQALFSRARLVGYRVIFSETARSPEGEGRIAEAMWVHPDLKTVLADENFPATFQVNP